jgi:hypothetical protein
MVCHASSLHLSRTRARPCGPSMVSAPVRHAHQSDFEAANIPRGKKYIMLMKKSKSKMGILDAWKTMAKTSKLNLEMILG